MTYCHIWARASRNSMRSTSKVSKYEQKYCPIRLCDWYPLQWPLTSRYSSCLVWRYIQGHENRIASSEMILPHCVSSMSLPPEPPTSSIIIALFCYVVISIYNLYLAKYLLLVRPASIVLSHQKGEAKNPQNK